MGGPPPASIFGCGSVFFRLWFGVFSAVVRCFFGCGSAVVWWWFGVFSAVVRLWFGGGLVVVQCWIVCYPLQNHTAKAKPHRKSKEARRNMAFFAGAMLVLRIMN